MGPQRPHEEEGGGTIPKADMIEIQMKIRHANEAGKADPGPAKKLAKRPCFITQRSLAEPMGNTASA